jgi:hypothetical protein
MSRMARPTPTNSLELGWRVHAAQEAWTAKVDVKASIILALVAGALVAVSSASGEGDVLSEPSALAAWFEVIGVVLLVVAMGAAGGAVFPMLGARRPGKSAASDLIYFGHLRHRTPHSVERDFQRSTVAEQEAMLARQIVAMSKRNWWKHRLLQAAISLGLVGALSVIVAVGINI